MSDTIERDIFIAAPAEKVWQLVSVPGWWINDGTRPEAAQDQFLYTQVTFTPTPEGWETELDLARAYLVTVPGATA